MTELSYPDVIEFEKKVNEYLDNDGETINQTIVSKSGKIIEVPIKLGHTLIGLQVYLGICDKTLTRMEERENPEYSRIITRARKKIERDQVLYGLAGIHNPKISELVLSHVHGYTRKTQTDVNINGLEDTLRQLDDD